MKTILCTVLTSVLTSKTEVCIRLCVLSAAHSLSRAATSGNRLSNIQSESLARCYFSTRSFCLLRFNKMEATAFVTLLFFSRSLDRCSFSFLSSRWRPASQRRSASRRSIMVSRTRRGVSSSRRVQGRVVSAAASIVRSRAARERITCSAWVRCCLFAVESCGSVWCMRVSTK